MTLDFIFWLLVVIGIVVVGVSPQPRRPFFASVYLFVLIIVLGWKTFGPMVK